MDPVKKEAPIPTAVSPDQTLVDKTGGIPGVDHSGQVDVTRKAVAGNLRIPQNNVTPEAELAEKNLGDVEKTGFLEAVAGIKPEGEVVQNKIPDSDSDSGINELKEHLNALSPVGGDDDENIRTASSGQFSDLVEKRKAA